MPEKVYSEFQTKFSIKEELGKGAFAVVFRCVNRKTKQEYAAKAFKKEKLTDRDLYKIEREVLICGKLQHPHIVHLHTITSDEKYHYLIFDLVTGGELFDDLVSRGETYTEVVTARCMFQLLETVAFCHSLRVIHRDLKPENILLESKESKVIKVADFGLAVELETEEEKWFGLAGTAHYIAPEVLEMKPYGRPVDCWACGVIMYTLITGFLPFHHEDERRLNELIKNGDCDLQHKTWDSVTVEGKDLVQKLLCVVPSRRITAEQALKHSWFIKMRTTRENILVRSDTVDRLKQLNAKRRLKDVVHTNTFISSVMTWRRRERIRHHISTTEHTTSLAPSYSGKILGCDLIKSRKN